MQLSGGRSGTATAYHALDHVRYGADHPIVKGGSGAGQAGDQRVVSAQCNSLTSSVLEDLIAVLTSCGGPPVPLEWRNR